MMYDELVKRLRNAAKWADKGLVITPSVCMEAADAIEELSKQHEAQRNNLIALLNDKPCWIPVEERLPKHAYGEGDSVLTVSSLGSMRVLCFDGGNWCYPTGEALTTAWKYPITHWMRLPEPPKGDE